MDQIKYIADSQVNQLMDQKIRDLLTVCFPDQPIFRTQRFYHELPAHRWYIEKDDCLTAHIALHEKLIKVNGKKLKIGGIAEVAVHPEARGRGYVRLLLKAAHNWLINNGYDFAMLFGEKRVYQSSGYESLDSPYRYFKPDIKEWIEAPIDCAMVTCLGKNRWPEGLIDLGGPMF